MATTHEEDLVQASCLGTLLGAPKGHSVCPPGEETGNAYAIGLNLVRFERFGSLHFMKRSA